MPSDLNHLHVAVNGVLSKDIEIKEKILMAASQNCLIKTNKKKKNMLWLHIRTASWSIHLWYYFIPMAQISAKPTIIRSVQSKCIGRQ